MTSAPANLDSVREKLRQRWQRLRERALHVRTSLVADPRFLRWASRFPLTRRHARRQSRALFDLCAGFVYSQILGACVKLDLFERLRAGPLTAEEFAAEAGLPAAAARRLLLAAASLELLRVLPRDRFALADLGAAVLGNPGVAAFVAHHHLLYDDLADPIALLRGEAQTKLSRFWPYAAGPGGEPVAGYSSLMTRTQALVAGDILDAYCLARHRTLMDVGGGEGAFLEAVAERAPYLKLILVDLPAVAERAQARLAGPAGPIKACGADFLNDPLPRGADVVTLVRVLHDLDDEAARTILKAACEALPRGGAILVAEPMSGAPGAEPIGDAYFGFYLLAMGRGRPRRPTEIASLLREAGFSGVGPLRTRDPMLVSLVMGVRRV
jgi:demethylspheroidene O-methyltransferase